MMMISSAMVMMMVMLVINDYHICDNDDVFKYHLYQVIHMRHSLKDSSIVI